MQVQPGGKLPALDGSNLTNVFSPTVGANSLLVWNSGNTHKVTIGVPPGLAADFSITLPSTTSGTGYTLTAADSAGTLIWTPPALPASSGQMTNQLVAVDGSAVLPGYAFAGDTGTGLYDATPGTVALAAGSLQVFNANSSTLTVSLGTPSFGVGSGALVVAGGESVGGSLNVAGQANANNGFNAFSGGYMINGLNGLNFPASDTTLGASIAIGANALGGQTPSGNYQDTAVGYNSLNHLTNGGDNVAVGYKSGFSATTGSSNTLLGWLAGYDVTTGNNNIVIGNFPTFGTGVTTGSENIIIGQDVRPPVQTGSNQLNIGNLIYGTGLGTGAAPATGGVSIGTSTPSGELNVFQDSSTAAVRGVNVTVSPAGTPTTELGIASTVNNSASSGTPIIAGIKSQVQTEYGETVWGIQSFASGNGTGTISDLAGIETAVGTTVNENVTGAYGLEVDVPIFNGTTSTYAGVYIADPTGSGAVNNYGIYSAGGSNFFGGNVGIGQPMPTSALEVSGGAIVSDSVANAGANFNMATGNVQVSSTSATTINLCGLADGGSYTLILTGLTASSNVTVNGYTSASCTGPVTVDMGAGATTFMTAGNTNIISFVYTTHHGNTLYGSATTNFVH